MKHLRLSQKEIMSLTDGGKMPTYDENGNRIVERDSSLGSNLVWAIAIITIVAIVAAMAYYGIQQMNRNTKHDIDIKIEAPAR
jgi:hypothetical protein